ncbi:MULTISPECIES: hypothetical protein [unclassified Streptomyces]|uniref:hypothetical protein n=1 Tax=unclassified Streptomyces TaxID=2593676 RepID=UPI003806F2F4
MTYREGAWVWDKERCQVGQVMEDAERFGEVYLRPPDGGREWSAKPLALRLASRAERAAAGVAAAV